MSSLHRAGQTEQRKISAARARDVKTPPVCRALTALLQSRQSWKHCHFPFYRACSVRWTVPSYYDRTVRVDHYTLVNVCSAKQIIHTLTQFITIYTIRRSIFHVIVIALAERHGSRRFGFFGLSSRSIGPRLLWDRRGDVCATATYLYLLLLKSHAVWIVLCVIFLFTFARSPRALFPTLRCLGENIRQVDRSSAVGATDNPSRRPPSSIVNNDAQITLWSSPGFSENRQRRGISAPWSRSAYPISWTSRPRTPGWYQSHSTCSGRRLKMMERYVLRRTMVNSRITTQNSNN